MRSVLSSCPCAVSRNQANRGEPNPLPWSIPLNLVRPTLTTSRWEYWEAGLLWPIHCQDLLLWMAMFRHEDFPDVAYIWQESHSTARLVAPLKCWYDLKAASDAADAQTVRREASWKSDSGHKCCLLPEGQAHKPDLIWPTADCFSCFCQSSAYEVSWLWLWCPLVQWRVWLPKLPSHV